MVLAPISTVLECADILNLAWAHPVLRAARPRTEGSARCLSSKPPLDPLAAVADLLDRLLHRGARLAGLLRFIADFVVLLARDPSLVLLAAARRLLLCHAGSPLDCYCATRDRGGGD